ncbi:MAG: hypothetical protein ABIK89_11475 [Planctomycetota bacterium]
MAETPTDLNEYRAATVYRPDPKTIAAEAARIKAANLAAMVDPDRSRYEHTTEHKTAGIQRYSVRTGSRGVIFRPIHDV